MSNQVLTGSHPIGGDAPVYVIAEIGLNHNGSLDTAKRLIDVAAFAGAQAVKFQKRTPDIATPEHMKDTPRETPWGTMTYLEYRHKLEFGNAEYREIARYASEKGLDWFASPWDVPSVDFLEAVGVPLYKVPSAALTDDELLSRLQATGKPMILSTGMSTMEQIEHAVELIGTERLVILHATSTYPLPPEEANLRMIPMLQAKYAEVPVGYSGHEPGIQISLAAVALGAQVVERHITLNRTMWGSDHAASLEPAGFSRLIRDIRVIEEAFGDGVKKVYPGELAPLSKLRRIGG